MAQLIIGHVTDTTARIWVQGDQCRSCEVTVESSDAPSTGSTRIIPLSSTADYAGAEDFVNLQKDTVYSVEATFSSSDRPKAFGAFRTMAGAKDEPYEFSFVLSSCNLAVVNINDLLAYLLAAGGTVMADFSLDLRLERWKWFGFVWLRRLVKEPLRWALKIIAGVIKKATGIRQPGPPFLRSPFLKLAAVFDSWLLEVVAPQSSLPMVGNIVSTTNAQGVLASAPTQLTKCDEKTNRQASWRLVVTQVQGEFAIEEALNRRPAGTPQKDNKAVGSITKVAVAEPWYPRPAFFIHAGDQIYYDFPNEDRRPDLGEYRLAYHEAWFDDDCNRYLLSHWPHYMTLDDHEIVDQFALDFNSPVKGVKGEDYRREAMMAYREYVHSRNPVEKNAADPSNPEADTYWYSFDKGSARFFVLDTRTRRKDNDGGEGQIIDRAQMDSFLAWMGLYKRDLKFVVTSVPFVAQIRDASSDGSIDASGDRSNDASRHLPNWYGTNQSMGSCGAVVTPLNPENDKWSAARFKRQRDEIIDFIAHNGIEHLVFLTGDMHCCYHAAMQIGAGSKYECTTVHELAGGPANQLQLADASEFIIQHVGTTSHGSQYEIVLDRFHSEVNGVMHLKVTYVDWIAGPKGARVPEVEWNVIRTLTDTGSSAWKVKDSKTQSTQSSEKPEDKPVADDKPIEVPGDQSIRVGAAEQSRKVPPLDEAIPVDSGRTAIKWLGDEPVRAGEPTMSGRISFIRKRQTVDLPDWPKDRDGTGQQPLRRRA